MSYSIGSQILLNTQFSAVVRSCGFRFTSFKLPIEIKIVQLYSSSASSFSPFKRMIKIPCTSDCCDFSKNFISTLSTVPFSRVRLLRCQQTSKLNLFSTTRITVTGLCTSSTEETTNTEHDKQSKVVKVIKKPSFDYNYTGNVFILPVRAMHEYLLTPQDLQELYKYKRRSPYLDGPPIILYLRTDVQRRAVEVWGSLELLQEQKKRLQLRNDFTRVEGDVMNIRLGATGDEYVDRLTQISKDAQTHRKQEGPLLNIFWKSGSGRVVLVAIIVNGINTILKCFAWLFTGSSSMFSEFVHSLADTLNQVVLGFGLYHSIKAPDVAHPYGYQNLRYISSLISGVGIFCFGTGVSWYHGFQNFLHPEPLGPLYWAIFTLMGSLISEGASLFIAVNQTKKSAKAKGLTFLEFVREGHDPNVNVVLLEDLAAVMGVSVAAVCMSLTQYLGHTFPDSLGSIIIGALLGGVATFIIYTNTNFLIGRSIPQEMKNSITQSLECDRMIRSLHDVKATQMGGQIRFKAEIDFDGQEITRAYLYKLDLDQLLMEMHTLENSDEVEAFMLRHGTEIIDTLGAEVDRIENVLKKCYPALRHVDLEAL